MFDICNLTKREVERYGRQLIMPNFGVKEQMCLKSSKVLIIGCGGIGCPSALYLAAAGVGNIGLIDIKAVNKTNLHKQILHSESDIELNKAKSLGNKLMNLNSIVEIEVYEIELDRSNASELIKRFDVVLDCTQSAEARCIINEACVLLKKPLVSANVVHSNGQLTVYNHEEGPCYSCVSLPPQCTDSVSDCGLHVSVLGVIGIRQAMETIKIISKFGASLSGKLFHFDAGRGTTRIEKLGGPVSDCGVCGVHSDVLISDRRDNSVVGAEWLNSNVLVADWRKQLSAARVLLIGCGGLGCPAGLYLAAAGVGCLGLVDGDCVDESNLHRQIGHSQHDQGVSKVISLRDKVIGQNPDILVEVFQTQLRPSNALEIVKGFDVVLDCTDNVVARYLVNDACVLLKKPLVSASALRSDGQLTVYNHEGGPCYRCLYPRPPNPGSVTNCSDGGVLGPVPGMLGAMQAVEAIKVIQKSGASLAGRLFMYDAEEGTARSVKLRSRHVGCSVCGDVPSIAALVDYERFCGMTADDKCKAVRLLQREDRVSVEEYRDVLETGQAHLLLDVRPKMQIDICRFSHSLDVEFEELQKPESLQKIYHQLAELRAETRDCEDNTALQVFVLCRRGNNSQLAVELLRRLLQTDQSNAAGLWIRDVMGGLRGYLTRFGPDTPVY